MGVRVVEVRTGRKEKSVPGRGKKFGTSKNVVPAHLNVVE